MNPPKKKETRKVKKRKRNKNMKLMELLHSLDEEAKEGLVNLEDWRWPDIDHLATMGFKFVDDYHMQTEKPPKMVVYKKKDKDKTTGKQTSCFYIEEPKKPIKRFANFNDVIDFFDNYRQPELEKNM